jgi:hypothetical protein
MADYGTNRAVLTWNATGAEYVTVEPDIGYEEGGVPVARLPVSGSWTVYPDTVGRHEWVFTAVASDGGPPATFLVRVGVNICPNATGYNRHASLRPYAHKVLTGEDHDRLRYRRNTVKFQPGAMP